MTEAELEAAGLYAPSSATAAQRLALLRWLEERGVTLEQMVAGRGSLSGLAGDLALRPGRRITAREIAAQFSLDVEQVLGLSLAAGLSPRTADAPAYTEEDFDLFAIFVGGAAMFGDAATRHFTRVVGSSLSRCTPRDRHPASARGPSLAVARCRHVRGRLRRPRRLHDPQP